MWKWSGLCNLSINCQVCIHIKSLKSSLLWCWKYSNKIMDVFGFCVLSLAVAIISENPIHQKSKEWQERIMYVILGTRQLILYKQLRQIFFFNYYFYIHRHTHICKQWRHLGRLFLPNLLFPYLSYEPIWNATKVDRTVFSEYWVKPRITCTNIISLNSSQNGSTEIPSPRLL